MTHDISDAIGRAVRQSTGYTQQVIVAATYGKHAGSSTIGIIGTIISFRLCVIVDLLVYRVIADAHQHLVKLIDIGWSQNILVPMVVESIIER